MQLLKVEKLNKSFGGLKAVCDLDFKIEKGEIVGLIGPNGSGKTTTLNLITGHLRPDDGAINFNGTNLAGRPRCQVCRQGIVRTFQLIKPFLELKAIENIMIGRVYGRKSYQESG